MPLQVVLLACLTVSSCVTVTLPSDENELELVQVLFRHGERTPLESETYPRDPYTLASYYEPWGRGQLTELGRFRMRRFGQALRRRYGGFLRTLSGSDDIYAYSADIGSCIASLQVLINALRIVDDSVTIRNPSRSTDMLLNSRACSKYETELKRVRRLPEVLHMMTKYEGLYSYIIEKTGVTFDDIAKDQRLYQLYNLLDAQRSMNLSLPNWCPEGVFSLLNDIAYLHFNFESFTQELRRLNGGPIVRRFLDNMLRTRSRNNPKLHLYSGEDHNVAAFTRAINRHFPRVPNYSTAIIVEKHRGVITSQNFVRVMIWTGGTEKLIPIRLSDCTEVCSLEDYASIVAKSLPSNEDMQCLLNDSKKRKFVKI